MRAPAVLQEAHVCSVIRLRRFVRSNQRIFTLIVYCWGGGSLHLLSPPGQSCLGLGVSRLLVTALLQLAALGDDGWGSVAGCTNSVLLRGLHPGAHVPYVGGSAHALLPVDAVR